MLIALSGVDSAGKSTQVGLLRLYLTQRHIPSRVMWHRPGYSPLLDTVRAAIRHVRPSALPSPGRSSERAATFSRPEVQRMWVGIAIMDSIWHSIGIRWALARGTVVISDRYLDDWMLDLRLNFPQLDAPSWPLARLLRLIAPRPDLYLLLLLDVDEASRRACGKDEPFPDTPDIRRERFSAYQQLAASGRLEVIDAGKPPEKVHEEIVKWARPLMMRSP